MQYCKIDVKALKANTWYKIHALFHNTRGTPSLRSTATYFCETRCLTSKAQDELGRFEMKMLRKIYGAVQELDGILRRSRFVLFSLPRLSLYRADSR